MEVGRVVGRKGRLGPRSLLSHGGHRRDISGLKELAFWTCPLPPPRLYPYTPSHSKHPPTPSSFLGPASLDAALGQASWGHCHCLHVKQSACEGRERKRRASHGTSQERGRLPRPSLHRPPLLAARCWCDPSTPFLPECPSHFPLCNPFLSAPLSLSLSVTPSFLRGPFERR